jgi:SAM-dependent methyltransferase
MSGGIEPGVSDSGPSPNHRFRFTTIAHQRHRYLSPVDDRRVAWLLEELSRAGLPSQPQVIDVGCGKAELALQIVNRFGGRVTAVDPNAAFLLEAEERANALGLRSRLHIVPATVDKAGVVPASFDLASCIGASHAFGDFEGTVSGLRELTRSAGLILIGDGYWRRPPSPMYLAFLGANDCDYRSHHENERFLRDCGLVLRTSWESSFEEWDGYEDLYASTMLEFLATHPTDPEHDTFRRRIESWRTMYRAHGRETLGFGWYLCQT